MPVYSIVRPTLPAGERLRKGEGGLLFSIVQGDVGRLGTGLHGEEFDLGGVEGNGRACRLKCQIDCLSAAKRGSPKIRSQCQRVVLRTSVGWESLAEGWNRGGCGSQKRENEEGRAKAGRGQIHTSRIPAGCAISPARRDVLRCVKSGFAGVSSASPSSSDRCSTQHRCLRNCRIRRAGLSQGK